MARPVSGTISMNGLEEKVTIRALRPEEYPLLADLLYEAIFVQEGAEVPPRAVVHDLALSGYWAAFGSRPGDRALCAVAPEGVVGAVWARRMRGYGFVADDVPELAMALWPAWRGRGLGTRLLQALLRQLRGEGVRQVSLSVQRANRAAWRLYERNGFRIVREEQGECILVRDLDCGVEMNGKRK